MKIVMNTLEAQQLALEILTNVSYTGGCVCMCGVCVLCHERMCLCV